MEGRWWRTVEGRKRGSEVRRERRCGVGDKREKKGKGEGGRGDGKEKNSQGRESRG